MLDKNLELSFWSRNKLLLGIDEAGMGCLAGSLYVAGVIFPHNYDFTDLLSMGLNDSKQVIETKRSDIYNKIMADALFVSFKQITPSIVDARTAYHARFDAAIEIVNRAAHLYCHLFDVMIDGNKAINTTLASSTYLIKGDTICASIAAASIIAKVNKDREMIALHAQYPQYDWLHNKGYAAPKHKKGISKYGLTEYHRKTYCH